MNPLILGADSPVGQALAGALAREEQAHMALDTEAFLSLPKAELIKTLTRLNPSQVLYTATYDDLLAAETSEDAARLCDKVNAQGVAEVAEVCQKLQVPLLYHSSSHVFDGRKVHPYREEDETNPQSRHGQSKLGGERAMRELLPTHVILRTDWVFDAKTPYFADVLERFRRGQGQLTVRAQRFCPTPTADVARVLLGIARQVDCSAEVWGTYHYCALQPLAQETFIELMLQEVAKYDVEVAALLPKLQITKEPAEKPWIANSALGVQKVFETFGIKQRTRVGAVNAVLQQLCNYVPAETPVVVPEVVAEPERAGKRQVKGKSDSPKPARTDAKQTQ